MFIIDLNQQLFFFLKDTRVWIPDADKVWKAAKLLEDYNQNSPTLKLITEDDEIVSFIHVFNCKYKKLNILKQIKLLRGIFQERSPGDIQKK